jgi:integrase/recombinase XerD
MAKPGNTNRPHLGFKQWRSWRELSATTDPQSLRAFARRYLDALETLHYSERTVEVRAHYLARFARWCDEREVRTPAEVTRPMLERFVKYVHHLRKPGGQLVGAGYQKSFLIGLNSFFRWLTLSNYLPFNPAADLMLPRMPLQVLPEPLTDAEIERVFAMLDASVPIELRDRAMFETLYSTGLRRFELARVKLRDLDAARGTLFVRQGKGRKDRVVPIGERAIAWVDKYVDEVRVLWCDDPNQEHLFLDPTGKPPKPDGLTYRAHALLRRAGIEKPGACHLFRHTMATHMLEHGADVRYVQEMLGHANLTSTQIYTRVSIGKLKAVHTATHPKARLARKISSDPQDRDDDAPPAA